MTQPQSSTTEIEASPEERARKRYLQTIRDAGRIYLDAVPFSVPEADRQRIIDRCVAAFRQASARNPDLLGCTPTSIAQGFAFCALAGLSPGGAGAEVYLIPRKSVLEIQVGWRGYQTLAARNGCRGRAVAVHVGDEWQHVEGLDPVLRHVPSETAPRTWETLRYVYVVATFADGARDFRVIGKAEIEKRRRQAQTDKVWAAWPVEMALKTGWRYAAGRGLFPLDDLTRHAVEMDDRDVIEAETVRAETAAPALPDRSGLDALDALLDESPQAETVPATPTTTETAP